MLAFALLLAPPGTCSGAAADDVGRGQELLSVPAPPPRNEPAYYEMRTHVELEQQQGSTGALICQLRVASSTCQFVPIGLKSIYGTRSETFALQTNSFGLRYVTAVASGFVAAANALDQLPGCTWTTEAGKALVVFYDVTDVPGNSNGLSNSPPALLRVAVGPEVSHAFAVRAKTYTDGKTFVFLGDLLGRVFIIDVSGDVLFPAAPAPYRSPTCTPNCTPILNVLSGAGNSFEFSQDVVDGRRPNLLDLEIDGDELYCALGRAGIAVLDISRNLGTFQLIPIACLDTPGLAQGLALRGAGSGRQLLVGDSRSGMRLYGRVQEE